VAFAAQRSDPVHADHLEATVTISYLHKHIDGTDLDDDQDDTLVGEIVEVEDEDDDFDDHPGTALATISDLVHSDPVHAVAMQAGYVVVGAFVVARRVRDSRTPAPLEQMMMAAKAVGDHEAALEWAERVAEFRRDRHQRRMDLIELPARTLAILPQAAIGTGGALVGVGALMAAATRDITQVVKPIMVVAETVQFVAVVVSVAWLPVLLALPWITLMVLWVVGRRHEETSDAAWLNTAGDLDMDIQIDETTIARALEALRIPQITAFLKDGFPLQYLTTARRDGRGTHAVLRLPAGVTAERIARRRADLATGLYRLAKEVWPSTGSEAGILDLWVADKGALAEGAGPYPLLESGFVDVFKGVPFGKTLRGDPVLAPIIGRNTIIGGMPDQGKSSAARAIMAGVALDPTAEMRIWVPDANYDFEVFKPRCSRYVMGAEDEKIEQILHDLRELHAEVQTRGELLVQYQEPEVTRALADKNIGLHPLVCLLEEAHVALNHKEYGEEISHHVIEVVKLGRKRGIHLIPSTQAPTKTSMPRDVTRNCSNGVAFAVGDHHANDALLGQGAYAGGHRATELIPGTDKGTALVKGFTEGRSQIIQAYFISVAKGNDEVTPLIQRSLAEIRRRGRVVPGTDKSRAVIEHRDLLDDLSEVVGEDQIKLTDLASLLRDLAPQWAPYRNLNGKELKAQLKAAGVRTIRPGNIDYLKPEDLVEVIARRATADLDDWS
jgi:S-DNA-T family DNA segregation ATPase FtsK/SpoIIIE